MNRYVISGWVISCLLFANVSAADAAVDAKSVPQPVKDQKAEKEDGEKKENKQLFHINSIKGIIFGKDDTHIITSMDMTRPNIFEGKQLSDEQYFLRYLMYEDAQNYKLPVDDETVDKYLEGIQKDQGISLNEIKKMLKDAGYTYQEGRNALKMMYTNNTLLSFKIQERLIVADELVKKYHREHPEITQAAYFIQVGSVGVPEDKSTAQVKNELEEYRRGGRLSADIISWGQPYWLNQDEIAQTDILNLEPEQLIIKESAEGFDLYRLKEKTPERTRALDDQRYQEIVSILRQPLFEKLLKEYEQELWAKTSILFPPKARALDGLDIIALPEF